MRSLSALEPGAIEGSHAGDGTPQLDDKLVGEAEHLQLRAVQRLRKLLRTSFVRPHLPDLGGCTAEGRCVSYQYTLLARNTGAGALAFNFSQLK